MNELRVYSTLHAVAEGLRKAKPQSSEEGYARWARTVISISHELEQVTPLDPVAFLNASGLGAFRD